MATLSRLEHCLRSMDLAYTKRWVISPMFRESSVAEHSYRVACIAHYLAYQVFFDSADAGEMIHATIVHALYHDWEEALTGDVPGPHKDKENGEFRTITGEPQLVVKVADAIETGTWAVLWQNQSAWGSHPSNMAPMRDMRKIKFYAPQVPGLEEAAQEMWKSIVGWEIPWNRIDLSKPQTSEQY